MAVACVGVGDVKGDENNKNKEDGKAKHMFIHVHRTLTRSVGLVTANSVCIDWYSGNAKSRLTTCHVTQLCDVQWRKLCRRSDTV